MRTSMLPIGGSGGGGSISLKESFSAKYTYGGTPTYTLTKEDGTTTSGTWTTVTGDYINAKDTSSGGFKFEISALQKGTYIISATINNNIIVNKTYTVNAAETLEVYTSSTTSGTLNLTVLALAT